jgi:hypothetical protein
VKALHCAVGDQVKEGAELVDFEKSEVPPADQRTESI